MHGSHQSIVLMSAVDVGLVVKFCSHHVALPDKRIAMTPLLLIRVVFCATIILAAFPAFNLHADVTVDASEEQTAKALLKYLTQPNNGGFVYDNDGLDWNTHTLSFWRFGLREDMWPPIVTHLFYRFKPLANGKTLVHGDERSWYFDDKDKLHELWNPHWGPATPAEAQAEADEDVRRALGLPMSHE